MENLDDKDLNNWMQSKFEGFEANTSTTWSQVERRLYGGYFLGRTLVVVSTLILVTIASFQWSPGQSEASNRLPIPTPKPSNMQSSTRLRTETPRQVQVIKQAEAVIETPAGQQHVSKASRRHQPAKTSQVSDYPTPAVEVSPHFPVQVETIVETTNTRQIQMSRHRWSISVTPTFNTAYFVPLPNDYFHVLDFHGPANSMSNRGGLTFQVAHRWQLPSGAGVELFAGQRWVQRNFVFSFVPYSSEGIGPVQDVSVKGVAGFTSLGVRIATHHKHLPLVGSVALDRLTVGVSKFSPYYSRTLVRPALAINWNLNENMFIRPEFSYAVPIGRDYQFFKMHPMQFGVETGMYLRPRQR